MARNLPFHKRTNHEVVSTKVSLRNCLGSRDVIPVYITASSRQVAYLRISAQRRTASRGLLDQLHFSPARMGGLNTGNTVTQRLKSEPTLWLRRQVAGVDI